MIIDVTKILIDIEFSLSVTQLRSTKTDGELTDAITRTQMTAEQVTFKASNYDFQNKK